MKADVEEEWACGVQDWTDAYCYNYDSKTSSQPINKSPIYNRLLLLPGEHTPNLVTLTAPHSSGLSKK